MKKIARIIALSLSVLFIFSFALACSTKDNSDKDASKIRFYLWNSDGKAPAGFDEVVKQFNDTSGKDLGFELSFKFDTQSKYKEQLNLSMSAGEKNYDVYFDAGWMYLNQFSQKGNYHDLGEYFNNSNYPGLKKAFSQSYLNNNKFAGKNYAIPLTETFGEIPVAYIRKDWREEAANDTTYVKNDSIKTSSVTNDDLKDGIDNFDELEYYLYWVKDNKAGVVPALSHKDGSWGAWSLISTDKIPSKTPAQEINAGIKTNIYIGNDYTAKAYIENGEVVAVHIPNAKEEDGLNLFPAGFNVDNPEELEYFLKARQWQQDKIIDPDVMTEDEPNKKFEIGLGATVVQTIKNFANVEAELKANNPEAELEIYVANTALREKRANFEQTDFKAWNFLVVPKTVSKEKLNNIMKFMDWLFNEEENHDLFQYGIKGKHWEEAKDASGKDIEGTISTLGKEAYTFPSYLMTWNPTYLRYQVASDPKVEEYSRYMNDINRYVEVDYSEFSFNGEATEQLKTAVSIAVAKVGDKTKYRLGQIEDPVTMWNNQVAGYKSNTSLQASITTIRDELISQLQEYIDNLR